MTNGQLTISSLIQALSRTHYSKWKSGDITWRPYYQITHLQALTDYLDLLGVSRISKLPIGQGRPPVDDPQIHLGSIIPCSSIDSTASCLTLLSPIPFIRHLSQSVRSLFLPSPTVKLSNTTVNLDPLSIMPKLRGVNHPYFTRISSTHYLIDPPVNELTSTVHVGQIADYIKFDDQVRTKGLSKIQSMPFSYDDFAYYWNDASGANESDPRRISRVYVLEGSPSYQVNLSDTPVFIKDFFITPDQVVLLPPSGNPSTNAYHDDLEKELLSVLMEQRRNSRKGYEQRQERLLLPFNQGPDQSQDISPLEFKGNKRLRVRSASPVSRCQSSAPVEATQEPL
jgi:hypothetical protein